MLSVRFATEMGLLPLAWLLVLSVRAQDRESQWWWLALAFAVSWAADETSLPLPKFERWWLTLIFPISQTGIIASVLLPRRRAVFVLLATVAAAVIAVLWRGVHGPDSLLYSVACLCVVGIVWSRPELPARLRLCLLVYFGLGLAAWLIHVQWLIVATWWPYQAVRLVGLILFCWAVMQPGPSLRLVADAE